MRRFWKACLVLLLVALLPARGWAVATMALAPAGPAPAGAALVMPCHAEAAADLPLAAQDHHGNPPGASAADLAASTHQTAPDLTHSCASCDLCHTQLAPTHCRLQHAALPRAHAPDALPARDTGRLLAATLERPPRG